MKASMTFVFTFYFVSLIAQTTESLVYIGESGKLQYSKYANTGQVDKMHQVPDFSWAGYKNGGVMLPDVTAVDTLTALEGDNPPQIQQAINAVSAHWLREFSGFEKEKLYRIYSMYGKTLASGILNSLSTQIDISHLSPGVYLFEIQNKNVRLKFIKQD